MLFGKQWASVTMSQLLLVCSVYLEGVEIIPGYLPSQQLQMIPNEYTSAALLKF